jgi:hypothetical protein
MDPSSIYYLGLKLTIHVIDQGHASSTQLQTNGGKLLILYILILLRMRGHLLGKNMFCS